MRVEFDMDETGVAYLVNAVSDLPDDGGTAEVAKLRFYVAVHEARHVNTQNELIVTKARLGHLEREANDGAE